MFLTFFCMVDSRILVRQKAEKAASRSQKLSSKAWLTSSKSLIASSSSASRRTSSSANGGPANSRWWLDLA